jgi:large subunit ribosomal protein L14
MKAVKANVMKSLPIGARLKVVDNSGARMIEIVSVKGYHGVKGRIAKAGVGDIISGTIKAGNPDVKHKVLQAVVIRQKKEYRRADGTRISFEDNAAVILKDLKSGEPKGTVIKGPVSREVVDRFPAISRVAKVIV